MTAVGPRGNSGTWQNVQQFYLVNPPTGSNSLVATASGGDLFYEWHVGMASFYNVNQSTPIRTPPTPVAGTSITITSNATSPADLTASCAMGGTNSIGVTNQTQDGTNGTGNWVGGYDHATTAGATVTHTWSLGNTVVGVSLIGVLPPPTLSFDVGCPASGTLRVASSPCTVNLANGTFDGTKSFTLTTDPNTTITPSVGSPGNGSVTVTPTSGTSFSFTLTPNTVGTKNVTLTQTYGWTNPVSPYSYAITSADASTFTAKADGLWNDANTWTCSVGSCTGSHTTPNTGDTVVITGFHVTIPTGTTGYMGTCPADNTTYNLTVKPTSSVGASGWLEVQNGATLLLCGNARLGLTSGAQSNPSAFGILKFDTGSTFKFDNNNKSISYRIVPGATGGWNKLIIGSSVNDTCTFGTNYSCPTNILGINNGSANPILLDSNSTTDNMTFQIYGAGIKNCGSASKGCIEHNSLGVSNSYTNAGVLDIRNSAWDTTGTIQTPNGFRSTTSLNLLQNRFMRDLAGVFALSETVVYGMTKPCTLDSNVFSLDVGFSDAWTGCAIRGNVFGSPFHGYFTTPYPVSQWTNNLMMLSTDYDLYNIGSGTTPVLNNYFLGYATGGAQMHADNFDQPANSTVSGNIYDQIASDFSGSGHLWAGVATNASSYTRTGINNISLMNPFTGATAGTGNIGGLINGQPGMLAVNDHNTWIGAANAGYGAFSGHPNGADAIYPSNTWLQSYRSNLHYAESGTTNFGLGDFAPSTALTQSPNNEWNIAGITYNAFFGGSVATKFGPGVNPNCDVGGLGSAALGTHYNICTATSGIGANDINNIDPKFVDKTRNAIQWASRLHGQAATPAGVFTAMMNCQDAGSCFNEMYNWVRAGYAPTNPLLKAHNVATTPGVRSFLDTPDSLDIGAVPVVDVVAPVISVTSPAPGTISGTVSVVANSTDDFDIAGEGVQGVKFYYDDLSHQIGSEITVPSPAGTYTASFNTISISNGSHTIFAVSRDLAGNTTTSSSITVTILNLSSSKIIDAFSFAGLSPTVNGIVDNTAHTIALTVPYGTNLTALVPTISITGSSISPASGITHNFSTSPQTYIVTAADASTQPYAVTVTFAVNPAMGPSGSGGLISSGGATLPPVNTPHPVTKVIPPPTTPATPLIVTIPGCNNGTNGFSTVMGVSCANNSTSTISVPIITPTGSSTEKPTSYNFGTTTLKTGSTGNAVKELQSFLNNTMNLGLVIDGKLGPKTIAVIKKWQKAHGLVADGLVGVKTKAKMNAEVK